MHRKKSPISRLPRKTSREKIPVTLHFYILYLGFMEKTSKNQRGLRSTELLFKFRGSNYV